MLESNSPTASSAQRAMNSSESARPSGASHPDANVEGQARLIDALQAQVDHWLAIEITRARKMLARGKDIEAVLEALARGLTQKVLHGTMIELNSREGERREQLAGAVTRFFLREGDASVCGEGRFVSERLEKASNIVADAATTMVEH